MFKANQKKVNGENGDWREKKNEIKMHTWQILIQSDTELCTEQCTLALSCRGIRIRQWQPSLRWQPSTEFAKGLKWGCRGNLDTLVKGHWHHSGGCSGGKTYISNSIENHSAEMKSQREKMVGTLSYTWSGQWIKWFDIKRFSRTEVNSKGVGGRDLH